MTVTVVYPDKALHITKRECDYDVSKALHITKRECDYDVSKELHISKRDCDSMVQCPETEPEISLYLRVCTACREELVTRQVQRFSEDESPSGLDMLVELSTLHSKFSEAETNVNSQLREVS